MFFGGGRVSKHLASEYYREANAGETMLLPDSVLPATIKLSDDSTPAYNMTGEETREACRALRGSILRQEVYANDGSEAAGRPYTVSERNYTIEVYQPKGRNKYAVFLTHARETIDFHYERKLFAVTGNALDSTSATKAADPESRMLSPLPWISMATCCNPLPSAMAAAIATPIPS